MKVSVKLSGTVEPIWVESQEKTISGPLDGIADLWRAAPRRWGHPLHSICSYFAMFPPHIPRVFIEWLTSAGDVVYDPFSGRGTAPLEACRLGRIGIGSDASPLAQLLTAAKVDPPLPAEVSLRIAALRAKANSKGGRRAPEDIKMLYSERVLSQLSNLRESLNLEDRTDRFIMATILGMLHANYSPGGPAKGFSISMPNTFSMAPGYVRKYIAEHSLVPPDVDVLEMVERKIARMDLPEAPAVRGYAWLADARTPPGDQLGKARLIFTSPPYLNVIKYGKYNWIRLWMLGHEPKEVDAALMATASPVRYLHFMAEVLANLQRTVSPDGYVCLMIGDVRGDDSKGVANLAETVWQFVARPSGWRRLGILNDSLPEEHKVSRIWGSKKKGRATRVDRILILAPPGSSHRLPPRPRQASWLSALEWASSSTPDLQCQ